MPDCLNCGTSTILQRAVPSSLSSFALAIFVLNSGWLPTMYRSGVSVSTNGSVVKYGWHQSVSGAVGAMWRQRSVASAMESRVAGGDGRYLNISSSGWPECTRIVRDGVDELLDIGFEVEALPLGFALDEEDVSSNAPTRMYAGFVSHEKDA